MADQQIKAGSKEAFGEELMKFRLVATEPGCSGFEHAGCAIRHQHRTRKSPILLAARVYGNAPTGEIDAIVYLVTKADP